MGAVEKGIAGLRLGRHWAAMVAALTLLEPALAWHDTGHMVIAAIAYKRLSPNVRLVVDALLKDGDARSNDFITAACWADDTKNRTTSHWHYIDHYFQADGKPTNLESDSENVVWAIKRFSATLKDRGAASGARRDALRFLIHFVGDIHQPLHCASRVSELNPSGDRGGNLFKIKSPQGVIPKARNLHTLWDAGGGLFTKVGRPLDSDGSKRVSGIAALLEAKYGATARQAAHDLSPDSWAKEGFQLSRTAVYDLLEGKEPSDEYLETTQNICGRRVVTAGYRLAALLEKLLG